VDEGDWLAERFEAHRPHLVAVAYRMLGSTSEADDAVQESWLRLRRSDASGVENLDALLAVLDPNVVLRADRAAVVAGASEQVRGATAVAGTFSGRARFAQPALVSGTVGAVWAPGGRPRVVFSLRSLTGRSPKSIWSLTLIAFANSI
jgi:hypothetical protein